MPRLQLYLDPLTPPVVFRYVRPGGAAGTVPCLRLIAYARLAGQLARVAGAAEFLVTKCPIDTGAFTSIVPERISRHLLPGVVTPLRFAPGTPSAHTSLVIGGGRHPFDFGEMTLHLRDLAGVSIDVTVVAMFTRDGGRLDLPLILGLRGGLLDGRRLTAGPDPAAPFGQAWTLEDP